MTDSLKMTRRLLAGGTVLLGIAALPKSCAARQAVAEQAPTGRPWVLRSASQFRLPPPADTAAAKPIDRIDATQRERIAWWAAAAPSYRWNQIAMDAIMQDGLPVNIASRRLAVLHTALADAIMAAADSRQAHRRSSYPDEHAVAAATAAVILAELFPKRAADMQRMAAEATQVRLLMGVASSGDVLAAGELGRKVATVALERARQDGSDKPWNGSVPTEKGLWNGNNPVLPQAATWVPWFLASPGEFRPAAPAAHDSPERAAELAALKAYQRTPLSNARAMFWEAAAGGLRVHEYWNNHAQRLLMEYGRAHDALAAAQAFAILNVAIYDTGIATWDAKYAYWAIRPSQLDPEFKTVFAAPNHPSYPAAHACFSTAAAAVLADLFPRDAAPLRALAKEAGASRIWAGIHYASDVAAGEQIGEKVAARVIGRTRPG
jgi:membrane-associated phospholipid phosphatase